MMTPISIGGPRQQPGGAQPGSYPNSATLDEYSAGAYGRRYANQSEPTQKMTIDDLYELYGHLQGQIAATTNLAAAVAALHPDRQAIERVLAAAAASKGYQRAGGSSAAEKAYAAGMEHALSVFRAAAAGMKRP